MPVSGNNAGGAGGGDVEALAAAIGRPGGQFCLPYPFGGVGTHAITANQVQAVRFRAVETQLITGIGWDVHGSVAGGDVYVSLHDVAANRLAVSAEDTDEAATTGNKQTPFTAPYEVQRGDDYYAAIVCSGVCTLRGVSVNDGKVNTRFGTTIGLIDVFGDNLGAFAGPPLQLAADVISGFSSYPLLNLYT